MVENRHKVVGLLSVLFAAAAGFAQAPPAQRPSAPPPSQGSSGRIVEQVVARVNNEIITTSEYERAKAELKNEVDAGLPGLHTGANSGSARVRWKQICCAT